MRNLSARRAAGWRIALTLIRPARCISLRCEICPLSAQRDSGALSARQIYGFVDIASAQVVDAGALRDCVRMEARAAA
jgi:hypothetical protein